MADLRKKSRPTKEPPSATWRGLAEPYAGGLAGLLAELREDGVSWAELGRLLGLAPSAARRKALGGRPSTALEDALADAVRSEGRLRGGAVVVLRRALERRAARELAP